jgi:hypothetical protein
MLAYDRVFQRAYALDDYPRILRAAKWTLLQFHGSLSLCASVGFSDQMRHVWL